jgi:CheY-like chemotaxis protein
VSAGPILIVEDDKDITEPLAVLLRSRGYRVEVAHDGPSALRMAATLRPAFALVDLGLPVMDGFELAKRLRDMLPAPPVLVAVTGDTSRASRSRFRGAGFREHLIKPIDVTRLLSILEGGACNAM